MPNEKSEVMDVEKSAEQKAEVEQNNRKDGTQDKQIVGGNQKNELKNANDLLLEKKFDRDTRLLEKSIEAMGKIVPAGIELFANVWIKSEQAKQEMEHEQKMKQLDKEHEREKDKIAKYTEIQLKKLEHDKQKQQEEIKDRKEQREHEKKMQEEKLKTDLTDKREQRELQKEDKKADREIQAKLRMEEMKFQLELLKLQLNAKLPINTSVATDQNPLSSITNFQGAFTSNIGQLTKTATSTNESSQQKDEQASINKTVKN